MRRGAILAVVLWAAWAGDAAAAVRLCRAPAVGDVMQSGTQVAALRAAIDSWRRKVAHLGPRYGNWRLARDKRSKCARLKTNEFACVAAGRPCTIRQVPPRLRRGPRRAPLPRPGVAPPDRPRAI